MQLKIILKAILYMNKRECLSTTVEADFLCEIPKKTVEGRRIIFCRPYMKYGIPSQVHSTLASEHIGRGLTLFIRNYKNSLYLFVARLV